MAKPWTKIFSRESAEDKSLKTSLQNLDSLRGELEEKLAYDTKFFDSEPSSWAGQGQFELAGIETTITPSILLRLYSTEPWVYSAVMAIAETIAGIPWKIKKRTVINKTVKNEVTGKDEVVAQEVWTDASGGSLNRLFQFPNHHMSRSTFIQYALIDLIVTGDAYIYLDSDEDLSVFDDLAADDNPDSPFGRLRTALANDTIIKAMYRLPSNMVKPVPKAADEGMGLQGYVMESQDGAFGFLPAEIVHLKFPNPLSYWNGLSPLMAAILRILLDRYATEHMLRFYKSGARLGGMIETDKNLTKEQITRMQRSFENDFTGRANFYRTLVLPNGMKYKTVEQNPVETSVIEIAKSNREAILSVLRVPPIKVGVMDHANYANAKTQLEIFYDDTIKPRCAMLADGFNMKRSIMPDNRSYRVEFDFSEVSVLQEDYKSKADAAKVMLEAGLSVNEVRKIAWKAQPVEGGDKIKTIEDMHANAPIIPEVTAPATPEQTGESAATDAIAANQITDPALSLNGAQVTAMGNIISQVAQGFIPRATGLEMIIVSFSIPREAAERMMGTVGTSSFTPANDPSVAPAKPADTQIGIESGKDVGAAPADPFAGLPGPTVTSIMNIVGRVTREKISAEAGAAMIAAFGLPPSLAHKLVGLEYQEPVLEAKADTTPPANQPELADQIKPTDSSFEARVAQLVAEFMSRDKLSLEDATARAVEQARQEGLTPTDPNDPSGGKKPTLDEYTAQELAKLDPEAEATPEMVQEIADEYEELYGPEAEEMAQPKQYAFGMSKDQVVTEWKGFIDKTSPMISARKAKVSAWFGKLKSAVKNEMGANLKAYGLHKSRDKDDANEITDIKSYEKLIAEYIAEIDKSLDEAYKYGFVDTLVKFKFDPNNEAAKKALKEYGASRIKGIAQTTMDQINDVLTQAFEEGVAVTEVSQRIDEKFAEIESGRAETIARTETLTAVSMGREAKRDEFKSEFPDTKLLKMWVSAQDDKVRDSHQDLDGKSVGVDEEFKDGLRFPRDPNGEASEVINCRCTDITYAEEDKASVETTLPKKDESDEDES